MNLLLDERYPPALAATLRARGINAFTASELGLAGRSDSALLAAAAADGYVLLTENVADFAQLAGEYLISGPNHPGVLIALSSRFSRRPGAIDTIAAAVLAVSDQSHQDRLVYLDRPCH